MSKRPFDAFDYIVDDGTIEDPLYDVQEYRNRKSCLDGIDPNGSQIILLRITGAVCVIFGIIEIAFGSYLFDEFVNADAGAWWAVLVLPIAGVLGLISTTRFRVSFTLLFSAVAALIAIIGSATDGASSYEIRSLTTCGTQSSPDSRPSFYGISEDVPNAIICMTKNPTKRIYSDAVCYCTGQQGTFCGVYKFSSMSITRDRNCRYILSDYKLNLAASSALCIVSAIAATGLLTACIVALCFPTKRLKLIGLRSNSRQNSRRNLTADISPELEFGVSSNDFAGEDMNYH